VDAIVLPSSTAARRIASDLVASPLKSPGARVIAIGPRTAETALGCGLPVHAVAGDHSVRGVVTAVASVLADGGIDRSSDGGPDRAIPILDGASSDELATLTE